MYNYITTLVNNASYKAVRQYKSLEVADNQQKIEGEIRETVINTLKEEKLDGSVSLTLVQIRNVRPNAEILAAATQYVKSQNEIKIKENEVKLAKLESERMAALATNSTQSIAYIQAQAELNYSEAAKAGKINTIIVPRDFKGMVTIGK
jgi:regulator of protease activity HflC (stomatin/prohibitin superfamily)